eukprot:gene26040-29414_t
MSNAPERTRVPRPHEQADDSSASQDSDGKSVDGPNSGAKIQSKLDRDPAAPLLFAMGEDVFVIDSRDNKWKEGQVVGLKRGGKYDVCLLDGHEELNIEHANISKFAPTASDVDDISRRSEPKEAVIPVSAPQSDAKGSKPTSHGTTYTKSQSVEVQSHETGQYRRAIISVAHTDTNLYDVIYQDRTKEINVPENVIRPWA